jgi:hypothetical protein
VANGVIVEAKACRRFATATNVTASHISNDPRPARAKQVTHVGTEGVEFGGGRGPSSGSHRIWACDNCLNYGGGRGIRTPKGLAARWISSPLPCQLRLALRAHRIAYLRGIGRSNRPR